MRAHTIVPDVCAHYHQLLESVHPGPTVWFEINNRAPAHCYIPPPEPLEGQHHASALGDLSAQATTIINGLQSCVEGDRKTVKLGVKGSAVARALFLSHSFFLSFSLSPFLSTIRVKSGIGHLEFHQCGYSVQLNICSLGTNFLSIVVYEILWELYRRHLKTKGKPCLITTNYVLQTGFISANIENRKKKLKI